MDAMQGLSTLSNDVMPGHTTSGMSDDAMTPPLTGGGNPFAFYVAMSSHHDQHRPYKSY